jgi:hypothetical protein
MCCAKAIGSSLPVGAAFFAGAFFFGSVGCVGAIVASNVDCLVAERTASSSSTQDFAVNELNTSTTAATLGGMYVNI